MDNERKLMLNRRTLLYSGATISGVAVAAAFGRGLLDGGPATPNPLGPLRPVVDETTGLALLRLPEGFSYVSGNWRLDEMVDGRVIPGLHDGMGAFADPTGARVTLMRNYEIPPVDRALFSGPRHDPVGGGGVTASTFDRNTRKWSAAAGVLSGTLMNCSGGSAPGRRWLSCEETTEGSLDPDAPDAHGFVFEVPADSPASARPLRAMGRFRHESVCHHAASGDYFLTEDERSCGLYRFQPRDPANLEAGGRLQMLALAGENQASMVRRFDDGPWPVRWVDIDDPVAIDIPGAPTRQGVFFQGYRSGGARFKRLEGCWSEDGHVYAASTTGGWRGAGQIFDYDVDNELLHLIYASPSPVRLEAPDNLTSVDGGLIICENGRPPARLIFLTDDGRVFPVAENAMRFSGERGFDGDYRFAEWCGVAAVGDWVFVNIQEPGVSFAIHGPWREYARSA